MSPPPATIYAPATASGRAAVGMVRVSGPAAGEACRALAGGLPPPRRAVLRRLVDPIRGEPIDDALLLWMPGPGSFTGEDVLEIQHHGGPAVLAALLEVLSALPGLRLAEPGEFSRRAFLNGRLDLTAAEGLTDLIDAATRAQARQALRQLDGELGRLYAGWRERLLACLTVVEAELDFAEESEVPDAMLARVLPEVRALGHELRAHLADNRRGERLRAGLTVAVIGAPNTGKSSLVNLLARRDVAIVTPVPGTTRDVLEVALELDGLPVTLLDTAGLRETTDPVEAEGVRRARQRAATADLRLGVLDATEPEPVSVDGAEIVAVNKCDLAPGLDLVALLFRGPHPDPLPSLCCGRGGEHGGSAPLAPSPVRRMGEGGGEGIPQIRPQSAPPNTLAISCATGAGIDRLIARLAEAARSLLDTGDAPVLTRARHREALTEAEAALTRFEAATAASAELVLLAEELRLATRAVGRVTGRVEVEEVLDRIFATFCIGK